MKIVSWNVNGLRSVCRKNFLTWLPTSDIDIICLQEIKVNICQLDSEVTEIKDYNFICNSAIKKGYSGTAIYSKEKPINVKKHIGFEKFDNEGRYIESHFKNFILINIYLPHGGRQKEKLDYKLLCYKYLLKRLKSLKNKNVIITGDFNIAHHEIDLERPKSNKNNIMFTEKEREQITDIIKLGYIDSFRKYNVEGGHYTWWPYLASARERNIGWRIDYIFTSNSLDKKIKKANICKNIFGSDHCPIEIDL